MFSNKQKNNEGGYAVLLMVIILTAVAGVIATLLLTSGFMMSQTSLVSEQSAQAKGLADACAERGLQEIRDDDIYVGNDSVSLSTGDCDYTVSGASPNKTIQATGEVNVAGTTDKVTRKVKVETDQINPSINISSWQEVADF
ncbi:MAG: hypothetical protein HQ530_03620 [Parcubacteria group bacterium]|nr:hypothetical protein [Parcubacteria group bacterium]